MIRVLVCGGRDFRDRSWLYQVLNDINASRGIAVIIEGGARGADALAHDWAQDWASDGKIEVLEFPADWALYGSRAGPYRNQQMLEEGKPDLVVAFPGGRGTASMVALAKEAGVEVLQL